MQKILMVFPIISACFPIPRPDDPYAPVTTITQSVLLDLDIFSTDNLMEFGLMNVDYYLTNDDNFSVNGSIFIFDLIDFKMAQIVHYTPMFYQRLNMLVTQAMPIRVKGIHCINSPPALQSLFTTIRSFMSAKMKERVSNSFQLLKCVLFPHGKYGKN
jgi:CRAL/TRIO domain